MRVLIVEDDDDTRVLFSAILEQHGAVVRSTSLVSDALAMLQTWAPDVIVCDIALPGEDGYAFARALRGFPDDRARLPAVALTAYASVDDRRKAIEAGFDAHLAKPIDPDTLVEVVSRLRRSAGDARPTA
jgi:CheY-like chemotaxis protein